MSKSTATKSRTYHLHVENSRKRQALFQLTEPIYAAAAQTPSRARQAAERHHRLGRRHPRRSAANRRHHDQFQSAARAPARARAAPALDTNHRRRDRRTDAARLAACRHHAHQQQRRARRQGRGLLHHGAADAADPRARNDRQSARQKMGTDIHRYRSRAKLRS